MSEARLSCSTKRINNMRRFLHILIGCIVFPIAVISVVVICAALIATVYQVIQIYTSLPADTAAVTTTVIAVMVLLGGILGYYYDRH